MVMRAGEQDARSAILDPDVERRLRWRCRRGLLELDIVLGRFVDMHHGGLSEQERQTFDELLDMPDNPLWDLISGRKEAATAAQAVLLEKLRLV